VGLIVGSVKNLSPPLFKLICILALISGLITGHVVFVMTLVVFGLVLYLTAYMVRALFSLSSDRLTICAGAKSCVLGRQSSQGKDN
jgi:hypothetical protein